MMHRSSLLAFMLTVTACGGVSSSNHSAVAAERDSLKARLAEVEKELDEIKFGAERLLAFAKRDLDEARFEGARDLAQQLVARHPLTPEAKQAQIILASAESGIKRRDEAERRRREEAEREERRRREAALANMRQSYDQVKEVTWYYDKSIPAGHSSGSRVFLYMGHRGGGEPWLRFVIRYKASSWLFIERYTFKIDGNTYTIEPGYSGVERDNGYSGIWEWYDTSADRRELEIARAIANSKQAILRYEGKQYYSDRTITAAEKQAVRNILQAQEALNGLR